MLPTERGRTWFARWHSTTPSVSAGAMSSGSVIFKRVSIIWKGFVVLHLIVQSNFFGTRYLSKLFDQFGFLLLLVKLPPHREAQLVRWHVPIPGDSSTRRFELVLSVELYYERTHLFVFCPGLALFTYPTVAVSGFWLPLLGECAPPPLAVGFGIDEGTLLCDRMPLDALQGLFGFTYA